jgi:hypothetical protein
MPRVTLLIVLLAAAAGLVACSASPGTFSTELGTVVRSGRATEVDLAKFLPVEWDELYAFGPYSIRESNCQSLKLGWLSCQMTLPSSIYEHEYFLVFRQKSKIVHTEHHWRRNGDFTGNQRPQPVLRSSATFRIKLESNRAPAGQEWFRLEHVQAEPRSVE